MYSLGNELKKTIARSSKKNGSTLGSPFSSYQKVVVPGNNSAYFGKGTEFQIGLGPEEYEKANEITKQSAVRLPKITADRGLLLPSQRQLNSSLIGPGTYNLDMKSAFPASVKNQSRQNNTFGTAGRDTHFSKYASLHKSLIEKGLY